MKNETKHVCVGYNKPKGMTGLLHYSMYRDTYKCTCTGVFFEDDKWWCKKHAPSKIKEREDKSWQKYIQRINRNIDLNS